MLQLYKIKWVKQAYRIQIAKAKIAQMDLFK